MATRKTLSLEQCKSVFRVIDTRGAKRSKATDRALFAALLLCGSAARVWTWRDVVETFLEIPYAAYTAIKQMAVAKQLTIFPFNYSGFTAAHWVRGTKIDHAIFTVGATPLTTQEVTRRMKRYARLAGIPSELMSLRTISNTHNLLLNLYGSADEAADALDIDFPAMARTAISRKQSASFEWKPGAGSQVEHDPRLHGLGRRPSRPA